MNVAKRVAPSRHSRNNDGARSASLAATPLIPEQFKESFHLLDKDQDGQISHADLQAMFTSLGQSKSNKEIEAMLAEIPKPLNFAAYFTAMSSLLADTSSRDDLMGALMTFDEDDSGKISVKELKESLTSGRNALSEAEVDSITAQYSRNGKFNYHAFVESLAGA